MIVNRVMPTPVNQAQRSAPKDVHTSISASQNLVDLADLEKGANAVPILPAQMYGMTNAMNRLNFFFFLYFWSITRWKL